MSPPTPRPLDKVYFFGKEFKKTSSKLLTLYNFSCIIDT
nr:MAG TPA: hypothetical protein [Caudoviricetes sp.]